MSTPVRARIPRQPYTVGGFRTQASKRIKFSLTKAEGGITLSGALASVSAIDSAHTSTDVFDNVKVFCPVKPQPVLATNRPFLTVNSPPDPLERNHLNQIPGGLVPSQLVPFVIQACRRQGVRGAKLNRRAMLRRLRYIGRVEESSSINNPSPIAPLRVGGLCNFHLELADHTGAIRTPEQLRITVGMPLYITLPPEDPNTGTLECDEFRLTPFDPAPVMFGSSTATMSDLAHAVIHHVELAFSLIKLQNDRKVDKCSLNRAVEIALKFGNDTYDFEGTEGSADRAAFVVALERHLELLGNEPVHGTLEEVYDYLMELVIAIVRTRAELKPHGFSDTDKPCRPIEPLNGACTADEVFTALLAKYQNERNTVQPIIDEHIAPICETDYFDHFLGFGVRKDIRILPEELPMRRYQRLLGHLEAGIYPTYRAIREIKEFTPDALLFELHSRRANAGSGGRSDLLAGRVVQVEMDGSVTLLQQ